MPEVRKFLNDSWESCEKELAAIDEQKRLKAKAADEERRLKVEAALQRFEAEQAAKHLARNNPQPPEETNKVALAFLCLAVIWFIVGLDFFVSLFDQGVMAR